MALRVWLPLNGTLENKGISGVNIGNGNYTIENNGKIGKCIKTSSNSSINGIDLNYDGDIINNSSLSFGGWFKFNKSEINTAIMAKTFTSSATTATGNLIGNDSYGGIGLIWNSNNIYSSGTFSSMSVFAALRTSTVNNNTTYISINFDEWVHLFLTFDKNTNILSFYKDGVLVNSKTFNNFTNAVSRNLLINYAGIYGGNGPGTLIPYYINDVRIYDHCLSAKEIKEISQGLILHYKLDGWSGGSGENLMLGTLMTQTPIGTSTDYTNLTHIRYYNTSSSNCTISNNEATILLNSTSNLGISFERLASEINFDTSSYYTLSCEAKTTMSGAQLSIGTSYYKTDDTAVWRGGSNKKSFNSLNSWQTFTLIFKPDTDIKAICYCFTVNGTSGGTETATIRHCKLEKGSIATTWSPAPQDLGIDTTKITDSSGYGNDGIITGILETNTSDRYLVSTKFPTNACYIKLPEITYSNFGNSYTFSWWEYMTTVDGGPMPWGFSNGNRLNCYHTTNLCWNTGNSGSNPFIPTKTAASLIDNKWHHMVVTGDGTVTQLYIDGVNVGKAKTYKALTGTQIYISGWDTGTDYKMTNNSMNDFRIYATALSAEDILDLYHTSANVDNEKRLHSFEFVEDDSNRVDEQGLVHSGLLSSDSDLIKLLYDKELHIEPDGSVWAHIYHHNRPDLGLFSSTNDFANSVKIDDNRWFNATEIVNSFSSEWEFLIIYNFTQGSTVYKERWIQTKNPETAVFGDVDAADIIRVTGGEYKTGTWGGLYKRNGSAYGSAYWVMNNGTNGNWWGATGSFSIYQGGIPGYGGSITTTGCNDLYIRIDRFSSTPTKASIGRGSVYIFNDFIEK